MSLFDTFRERRPFPGQDPWVVAHNGELLLIQSAAEDRKLVIRRFRDLDHIDRSKETTIWDPHERGDHAKELWAPELHEIDGKWYVYYAASNGRNANHRMYALVANDPLGPYTELGPVRDVLHDVWAIDLTVFTHQGRLYAVWSGWEGKADGFPQNLYIAPMSNPWTISGERRCIARPEHDWEMSVAAINEGPEVLRDPMTGRLFIVYSADASWTLAYKMGLLEFSGGPDVTDPAAWRKLPRPFFTGGGHGCVVDTTAGTRLVYHRKLSAEHGWADREIRSAPLVWGEDGYPAVRPGGTSEEAGAAAGERAQAQAPGFPAGLSRVA